MLRISYAMAMAALLSLQAPPILAAEYSQKAVSAENAEPLRLAATTFQSESDKLARSDPAMQQQPAQSKPASATGTMEYPALALLAMAIISMAALSRRDSFRIDR